MIEPARVTIIMPAFNEALSIAEVVTGLRAALPEAPLIVVNDGSTDDTGELASQAGARVIDHDECQGYGASLRTGIEQAETEYVLFCDADGQHRVEDVAGLIQAVEGYDMVVGARGQDSHVPLVRRPGKWVLKHFANFLAGQQIPDLNSGLRICKRTVLLQYIHLMPRGFSFSTTSTFAFLKTHHRIKYVPIKVEQRKGTSTVRQLRHGPKTLLLMLRLTVLFEPLKVFLSVSAGLFLLCLISVGIDFSIGQQGIGDTTVLLAIAALMVFMFGLLCDQISAIRRERYEQHGQMVLKDRESKPPQ